MRLFVACLDIGRIGPSQTGTMTTPVAAILDKWPATALTAEVHLENTNNKLLQSATILGNIFFSPARPLQILDTSASVRPETQCNVLAPFLTPMIEMRNDSRRSLEDVIEIATTNSGQMVGWGRRRDSGCNGINSSGYGSCVLLWRLVQRTSSLVIAPYFFSYYVLLEFFVLRATFRSSLEAENFEYPTRV